MCFPSTLETHGTMGPVCFLTENEIVVQMDNQTRCFGDCFQQRPGLSESILMIEAWNRDHFTHRRWHYMNLMSISAMKLPHPTALLHPSRIHPSGLGSGSSLVGGYLDCLASHSSEPLGPQHSGLVHWQWSTMIMPEVRGRGKMIEKKEYQISIKWLKFLPARRCTLFPYDVRTIWREILCVVRLMCFPSALETHGNLYVFLMENEIVVQIRGLLPAKTRLVRIYWWLRHEIGIISPTEGGHYMSQLNVPSLKWNYRIQLPCFIPPACTLLPQELKWSCFR